MIRKLLPVFLTMGALLAFSLSVRAQMSDDAVVSYVREGLAVGKSQQELISELVKRGVTRE